MKTTNRLRLLLVLGFLTLAAGVSAAHAATWPTGHVNQAETWIFNPYIDPANNLWGDPASITVDANGKITQATAKCGSFTALLLKAAYPGVITDTVLTDLTGLTLPYALDWYNAILAEKASVSGVKFHLRTTAASIQPGDILASAYTTGGDTGHVMTVKSITLKTAGTTLTADKSDKGITDVGKVNKYQVAVYDATDTPHGAYMSNPAPDTRYRQILQNGTQQWITDTGLGSGTIVIYEEVGTGRIVAWAWNVSPTTTSYYYAISPNPGTYSLRPIVAGYLGGTGL